MSRTERMRKVEAPDALYIKLGSGGHWEEECLNKGTLRLGYNETPHEWCMKGQWKRVQRAREKRKGSKGAATSGTTQIQYFYEASDEVLWVTFAKHCLWWCFAHPKVQLLPDGTRVRKVKGRWRNTDTDERPLRMSGLSGKLLAMQGFRGTICRVRDRSYLLRRINAEQGLEARRAESALQHLARRLEAVIRTLTWRDFELLIDLIFRQAGWQRVSQVGSTMKSIDLDLISPITDERFGVQVKAKANRATFDEYKKDRVKNMEGFSRFYFAVHSPSSDLASNASAAGDEIVRLLLPSDIALFAARYGLASWVIDKAR